MEKAAEDLLRAGVCDVVQPVLAALQEGLATTAVPMRTKLHLVRESDAEGGMSARHDAERVIDFTFFVIPLLRAIRELPAFDRLLHTLDDDAFENVLLDAAATPVAGPENRANWLSQFVLVPFIQYYVEIRPDASWDEVAFDNVFSDLVRQADGEPRLLKQIAPLEHLRSSIACVELDRQTAVTALSDGEVSDLFDAFGSRGRGTTSMDIFDVLKWTHAIEHTAEFVFPPQTDRRPSLPDAPTALRLVRGSGVRFPFVWQRDAGRSFVPGSNHLSGAGLSPSVSFGTDLVLTEEDVPQLQTAFERLQRLQHEDSEAERRFELCLRRLNIAAERLSDDDRLIDYWVALETLFASDGRAEIGYRARTRVARYVADDLADRRQIATTLTHSYGARSKIVHGDKPKADLADLTTETGDILRRALRRMLERGSRLDFHTLDLA